MPKKEKKNGYCSIFLVCLKAVLCSTKPLPKILMWALGLNYCDTSGLYPNNSLKWSWHAVIVYISRILFPRTLVQFQGLTLGFYSDMLMGSMKKMGNLHLFKMKTVWLSLPHFFFPPPVDIDLFIFWAAKTEVVLFTLWDMKRRNEHCLCVSVIAGVCS